MVRAIKQPFWMNSLSILGVIIGLLILFSSFTLILWNESHTAHIHSISQKNYNVQLSKPDSIAKVSAKNYVTKFFQHTSPKKHKTRLWRMISLLTMILSVSIILCSIFQLKEVIPALGNFIGLGIVLVSFIFGLILWTTAILLTWIILRPLLTPLVFCLIYALYYMLKKQNKFNFFKFNLLP